MKMIVLLTVLIAVGCVLASGCVAQTKKEPVNGNVISHKYVLPVCKYNTRLKRINKFYQFY